MNTSLDVLIQAVNYVDCPPTNTGQLLPEPSCSSIPDSDFSCGSTDSRHSERAGPKTQERGQSKGKKTRRKSTLALSRQASSSAASASSDSWRTSAGSKRSGVKKNPENRSVHNVLEKNRRAHLKDCFEALKNDVLENDDDKKASHLAVLRSAVRCIQQIQRESAEVQRETDKANGLRSSMQLRLQELKNDMLLHHPGINLSSLNEYGSPEEEDSQATCTAPGSPPPSYSQPPPQPPPRRDPSFQSKPHTSAFEDKFNSHSHQHSTEFSQKSVSDILEEIHQPVKPVSSSLSQRDRLPLSKRILQDEQTRLFMTKPDSSINIEVEETTMVHSTTTSNLNMTSLMPMPQLWPAGAPFMQMYTTGHGGTRQSGFGLLPMMNQFLMPVSAISGQYPQYGNVPLTSPLTGHQVFMLPSSYGQPAQLPSHSSSPSTSSTTLSLTPSFHFASS